MLDDPKGLSSASRLYAAYNSMSHDFYESLAEFFSLEGEGANARAANARGAAAVWSFAIGYGADYNLLLDRTRAHREVRSGGGEAGGGARLAAG